MGRRKRGRSFGDGRAAELAQESQPLCTGSQLKGLGVRSASGKSGLTERDVLRGPDSSQPLGSWPWSPWHIGNGTICLHSSQLSFHSPWSTL